MITVNVENSKTNIIQAKCFFDSLNWQEPDQDILLKKNKYSAQISRLKNPYE